MHVLAADRVGGHGRDERGVDAARQSQAYAAETVLGHVVLQSEHARGVYLLVRIGLGRDRRGLLARGDGVQVEEAQVLHEHRRAFQQRSVGVDDEAATVEDQIVLAAHLVDVDQRRVHFGRAAYREVEARVGLAFLVWRAVHGEQQVDVLLGEFGHRAAVLPDVLADGHADAGAVHVEDDGFVAGAEDAEFVEDAVVRQEVLVVSGPYHAVVQYDEAVARFGGLPVGAHGADRHVQVAEPVGLQFGGEPVGLVPCGFAEGGAQGEVLDRVSGQGHFGEHDDLGAVFRGEVRVAHDLVGVVVEIAYAGVDLGECETNVCHGLQLSAGIGRGPCGWVVAGFRDRGSRNRGSGIANRALTRVRSAPSTPRSRRIPRRSAAIHRVRRNAGCASPGILPRRWSR